MKEPLSSIITAQAMSGYLRLFRLLWTLKRVEHTLNRVWQVMSGMQRQLTLIRSLSTQYGLPCPGLPHLTHSPDGVFKQQCSVQVPVPLDLVTVLPLTRRALPRNCLTTHTLV